MDGPASAPDQGALPLEIWEQPPGRAPGPGAAPMLAVDGFEGPLDWLLDLVRTRRIDLARLSIAALIAAFEAALAAALATPGMLPTVLGRWGDWLVMAADLTLLRSRMLVPSEAAEAQDAAEALRRRLLNRADILRTVDWLEARQHLGRDVFARAVTDENGTVRAGRTGDVTALLRACLVAIRLPPDAGALFRMAGPPFWSPTDAAERIRAMLPHAEDSASLASFLPYVPANAPVRDLRCRVAVAGNFLAGLEMARDGSIVVQQETAWETIRVRRGEGAVP